MLVKGKDCMKEVFVKDLRKDQEITDFFMAKTLAIKVGANGKQSAGRQDGRNFRQKMGCERCRISRA